MWGRPGSAAVNRPGDASWLTARMAGSGEIVAYGQMVRRLPLSPLSVWDEAVTAITSRLAHSIARSIRRRVEVCKLSLDGVNVITEAATNAYAVTAAAASYAGARVWTLNVDSPHGSAEEARRDIMSLSAALGTGEDLRFVEDKAALPFESADVVTNSGLLRPIGSSEISRLPDHATIALMYEAWEARTADIDLSGALQRGIRIVGVNEHHPACGAFDFVGDIAVAAILRRAWSIRDARIAVLSDNPFGPPIVRTLNALGATVISVDPTDAKGAKPVDVDLVVVATTPSCVVKPPVSALNAAELAHLVGGTGAHGCVHVWGDLDYTLVSSLAVVMEPKHQPPLGHHGIAMSSAGHEAVVRLQVAGLAATQHIDAKRGSPLFGLAQLVG